MRISDTCGVNNLHGMPAILSAICSAIFASLATVQNYKGSLTEIFPAMKQMNMTMDDSEMNEEMHMVIGVSYNSLNFFLSSNKCFWCVGIRKNSCLSRSLSTISYIDNIGDCNCWRISNRIITEIS